MRAGRKPGLSAQVGRRVSAYLDKRARRELGITYIYMIEPAPEQPLLLGNAVLERVLIGLTTNPTSIKAKAKQFGLGFDNRMFCWAIVGRAAAERVYANIAAGLDPFEDDPALGSWYSIGLEHAKTQISITAAMADVEVLDESGVRRLVAMRQASPKWLRRVKTLEPRAARR